MAVSQKQLKANRRNAARSTGPRTEEGKARSRGNSVKHGLTGKGIALPHEDAEAVEARFASMEAEMRPSGELARFLVRRVALLTVRIDRAALQESAALAERVREAVDAFDDEIEALDAGPAAFPPGLIDKARAEAGARASFDPSPEATLARRYEAVSERALFRTLRELREVESTAPEAALPDFPSDRADDPEPMGSFGAGDEVDPVTDPKPAPPAPAAPIGNDRGPGPAPRSHDIAADGFVWEQATPVVAEISDIYGRHHPAPRPSWTSAGRG
jgi:hypothetical protein